MKNTYLLLTLLLFMGFTLTAQTEIEITTTIETETETETDTIIERKHVSMDIPNYDIDGRSFTIRLGRMDFGISTYVDSEGSIDLPSELDFLDQVLWRSINVGITAVDAHISFGPDDAKARFGFSTGLKFNWVHYSMSQDYSLERNQPDVFSAISFEVPELRKNRLRGTYLQVPLLLEFTTNARKRRKSLHLGVGYVHQLLLGSQYKYKTTEGDKTKTRGEFNLRKSMGLIEGRIGIGHLNFYVQYGLNTLFQDGALGDFTVTPVNFGINIIPR